LYVTEHCLSVFDAVSLGSVSQIKVNTFDLEHWPVCIKCIADDGSLSSRDVNETRPRHLVFSRRQDRDRSTIP